MNWKSFTGISVALLCALSCPIARAQYSYGSTVINSPTQTAIPIFEPSDLDQLLGPVALYPDPLLAELLPAAMQPAQIVEADRLLQTGADPNQIDYQPWTSEVKAMAHYPDILRWMDENIAWTTQVGQAFANQYQDVMDSVQRLRAQAQSLGNLQTTPQENVVIDNGMIEIIPADPEIIYVPAYDPGIVYSRRGVFSAITFGAGLSIGLWLNRDWDWHNHQFVVWNRDHFRPRDWWYRPGPERFRPTYNYRVWHPRAPQHVWRPEDRGYDVRHEPVHIAAPRPREVIHSEPRRDEHREERREPIFNQPARPEEHREPARGEPTRREPERRQPESRREAPRVEQRAPEPQRTVPPPTRAAPAPAPAPRPNGALIGGSRSAPETRAYSSRGQQSRSMQNNPAQTPQQRGRH